MKEQINVPIAFNRKNRSHMSLLEWIDEQTTNRSSFIRETMVMRMMGMIGGFNHQINNQVELSESKFDIEEAVRMIQI